MSKDSSSLLICDSRGKGLELLINEECTQRNMPTRFTVSTSPGATIVKAVREAESILQSKSFDYIYLMAGVNNLTSKSSNGKITPTFNEIPNLVDVITDHLTWAKSFLANYSPRVIICHLIGLNIDTYNAFHGHMTNFHTAQEIINEGAVMLNQVVTEMNRDAQLTAPWIMDTVHSLTNGRRIHKYNRFYDGLHPNDCTQKLWAKRIAKAANTNLCLHLGR